MAGSALPRLVSAGGLMLMLAVAYALSENRKAVRWPLVAWGLGLQFGIGVLILLTPLDQAIFAGMQWVVDLLTQSTLAGAGFVFGNLATDMDTGAIVGFQVLPVIIFVSALAAMLYHLRVIQAVVRGLAWLMQRTLKTSGAETFGAALLVFLGIESMTAIRGYIKDMTRSELCTLMTAFMATIAGSVMVVYATFGAEPGHLLTASLMSAPAAIMMAKILVPETVAPRTAGTRPVTVAVDTRNIIDAAAKGASEGLALALNVGAMLIVFIGLIFLLNKPVEAVTGLSLEQVTGYIFAPFALAMGISPSDAAEVGQLLGKKTIVNEFVAYLGLQEMITSGTLSPRSIMLTTYALCGFANPGSLGILIAGLASIAPERRSEVSQLGLRAFIGGTLACFTTACVAGVLLYA